MDANGSLMEQLECPICFNYCKAPIFQCTNGHNLCGDCRTKISECGICRAPMSNARNWFAESVSEKIANSTHTNSSMSTPTPSYAVEKQYKCYVSIREDSLHHFREQCTWQGTISELMVHVLTFHKGSCEYGDSMDLSCKINFELLSGTVYPKLLSYGRQLFWCMMYYFPESQLLHLYVKKVVDDHERFVSEFVLENDGKSLVYRQATLSIDDDIRVGNKTLQLTRAMVNTFSVATTGRFACKVNLFKEELSTAPVWMDEGYFPDKPVWYP